MQEFFRYANTITVWIILLSQIPSLVLSFFSILFPTKPYPKAKTNHRYAVFIAARNEELVIGQLIDSIRSQDYPKELLDVYVVADNCTDATATIARERGAIVLERFNTKKRGKGYAIRSLLEHVIDQPHSYDGFFFFDADNVLSPRFVAEMNKAFDTGEKLVTAYRASKNFSTNWVAASTSLIFLRKNRFLHKPRQLFHSSTTVSGTGFLISKEYLASSSDWNFFGLTEDLEFTAHHLLNKHHIAYCEDAIFFDEQPETMKDSWNQRIRWVKGAQQAKQHLSPQIWKEFFRHPRISLAELLIWILPIPLIIVSLVLGIIAAKFVWILVDQQSIADAMIHLGYWLLISYLWSGATGLLIVLSEWRKIDATWYHKLMAVAMYPIWLYSYVAVIFAAFTKRHVDWKPIQHRHVMTSTETDRSRKK